MTASVPAAPLLRPYDLLVFDWDGTLADSTGAIARNMQAAIQATGLPPRTEHEIAELIGLGFMDALGRLYPELDAARVAAVIKAFRQTRATAENPHAAPLYAGVAEALRLLYYSRYRLAVATGKSRAGLDQALDHHGALAGLFVATRCAEESANKPHPLMLVQLLGVEGCPAGRALMVGDTEFDIAMARAAGVDAVGVTTGAHAHARLVRAGALAVLPSVAQLPRWLESQRRGRAVALRRALMSRTRGLSSSLAT